MALALSRRIASQRGVWFKSSWPRYEVGKRGKCLASSSHGQFGRLWSPPSFFAFGDGWAVKAVLLDTLTNLYKGLITVILELYSSTLLRQPRKALQTACPNTSLPHFGHLLCTRLLHPPPVVLVASAWHCGSSGQH